MSFARPAQTFGLRRKKKGTCHFFFFIDSSGVCVNSVSDFHAYRNSRFLRKGWS